MNIQDITTKTGAGVYCIENLVNKKFYIGSSSNIYYRLYRHKSDLIKNKHGNSHLQYSYNKYGKDNFRGYVLELCNNDVLLEKEQFYINQLLPEYNKILNVVKIKLSESSKKQISETLKKKYKNGEIKTYKQEHRWRSVDILDLNNNFISRHQSPKIASDYIGAYYSHLSRCLNNPEKHKTILGKYRIIYTVPAKLGEFGETLEADNTEPSLGNS